MNKIYQVLGAGMFLIMSMHTQANIKQHIEKTGFCVCKTDSGTARNDRLGRA